MFELSRLKYIETPLKGVNRMRFVIIISGSAPARIDVSLNLFAKQTSGEVELMSIGTKPADTYGSL